MSDIKWPQGFIPGLTDNYVSNELIIKGLTADQVWRSIIDTSAWPLYYSNVSDIHFYDHEAPLLKTGTRFKFTTFSFLVEAEVVEFQPPAADGVARIAWHGWVENEGKTVLDVYHAWLFENLSEGRVRILTQETQNGAPARELATTKPNPMLNAHQEWIEGLAGAAMSAK